MGDLTPFEQVAIYATLTISILGLGYAIFLRQQILRHDKGTANWCKRRHTAGAGKDGPGCVLKQGS